MKPRILIIPSNFSKEINRIKNVFEAAGAEVEVLDQTGMDILNAEFKDLPINQKFSNVFKLIGNMKKKEQKTQKQNR